MTNVQLSNININNTDLINSLKKYPSPTKQLELAVSWLREHDPRNLKTSFQLTATYKELFRLASQQILEALSTPDLPVIPLPSLNAIVNKHVISFERAYVGHYEDDSDVFVRALLSPSFEIHFEEILKDDKQISKYTRLFHQKIDMIELVDKTSPLTYCHLLQRILCDKYLSTEADQFKGIGIEDAFQKGHRKIDFDIIASNPTALIEKIFKTFLIAVQENKAKEEPFNFDFLYFTMASLLMFNKHKHFKALAKANLNLLMQLVKTLCKMERFEIYNQAIYNGKRLHFILPNLQERLSKVYKA